MKLASCKSALNHTHPLPPPGGILCWPFWGGGPGFGLTLCCFVVYSNEAICFMSHLVLFCSCVFSPFSIAITSLGEKRANLSAFRTFVRFALVWFCLFSLPLGVWEGLRFVIVALPELSLTFFTIYV